MVQTPDGGRLAELRRQQHGSALAGKDQEKFLIALISLELISLKLDVKPVVSGQNSNNIN